MLAAAVNVSKFEVVYYVPPETAETLKELFEFLEAKEQSIRKFIAVISTLSPERKYKEIETVYVSPTTYILQEKGGFRIAILRYEDRVILTVKKSDENNKSPIPIDDLNRVKEIYNMWNTVVKVVNKIPTVKSSPVLEPAGSLEELYRRAVEYENIASKLDKEIFLKTREKQHVILSLKPPLEKALSFKINNIEGAGTKYIERRFFTDTVNALLGISNDELVMKFHIKSENFLKTLTISEDLKKIAERIKKRKKEYKDPAIQEAFDSAHNTIKSKIHILKSLGL